ncbi:recombinase family protein [Virgibacillus flavescens]|uniref:recombinase family protein n=1 Tax=Virgibacillus flavescens TaxID=1611422 RepID=UPI003D3326E3
MRCAAYIRVSTDKEEQKASLKNQQDLFLNFISEKGWDVHDFYVDVESGTTDKREKLQELIDDASNRKFDIIIAKELSRLARNGGLSYQIRDMAFKNNIDIITLDGAINTLSGDNSMFGLYAWIYEQESQRTSERVKASFRSRATKGVFLGSIAPYGYHIKNQKLIKNTDETPLIVKRIYSAYLSGKGFDRIARELYEEGYPTPAQIAGKKNAGDKWQGSSIRCILSNPHYTGVLVQGRETTRNVTSKARISITFDKQIIAESSHEPIISADDFKAVGALMESRKRIRPQAEVHLFTNTAFCADCGKGMHFKKNRKGYICGSYNKHGIKACTDHHVKENELYQSLLNDLYNLSHTLNISEYDSTIKKRAEDIRHRHEQQINTLDTKIEKIKARKTKLINHMSDGIITKEEYHQVIDTNNEEIKSLILQKENLYTKMKSKYSQKEIHKLKKELVELAAFKKLSPEILHKFIQKIEIKADGTPRIYYRFSDPTA